MNFTDKANNKLSRMWSLTLPVIVSVIYMLWLVSVCFAEERSLSQNNSATEKNPTLRLESGGSLAIPSRYGRIVKQFIGKSNKTIIQIQDYHSQYDAQEQNAHILDYLATKYDIKTVALEGAKGDFDLSVFKGIEEPELRKNMTEMFMREGKLSGAEFFAINTNRPVVLQGIEDINLYMKNVDPFIQSQRFLQDAEFIIDRLRDRTALLQKYIYNEDLKNFERRISEYENQNIDFSDHCVFLYKQAVKRNHSPDKYPNMKSMYETALVQKNIDFEKIEIERENLLRQTEKELSAEESRTILEKSIRYKLGEIPSSVFHKMLVQLCQKYAIPMDEYVNLKAYVGYIANIEAIDADDLFRELEVLTGKVRDLIFKDNNERILFQVSRRVDILDKLYHIKLSNADLKDLQGNIEFYKYEKIRADILQLAGVINKPIEVNLVDRALNDYTDTMLLFYESAAQRDIAMLANIDLVHQKFNTSEVVLVCGGFHTDNLTRLMEERGISYAIIAPRIIEGKIENKYLERLRRTFSPFETYLLQNLNALSTVLWLQKTPIDDIALRQGINNWIEFIVTLQLLAKHHGYDLDIDMHKKMIVDWINNLNLSENQNEIRSEAIQFFQDLKILIDRPIGNKTAALFESSMGGAVKHFGSITDGESVRISFVDDIDSREFEDLLDIFVKRNSNREIDFASREDYQAANDRTEQSSLPGVRAEETTAERPNRDNAKKLNLVSSGIESEMTVTVDQGSVVAIDPEGKEHLIMAGFERTFGRGAPALKRGRTQAIDPATNAVFDVRPDIFGKVESNIRSSFWDLNDVPQLEGESIYTVYLDTENFRGVAASDLNNEIEAYLRQLARLAESRNEKFMIKLISSAEDGLVSEKDKLHPTQMENTISSIIKRKQEFKDVVAKPIQGNLETDDIDLDTTILITTSEELIRDRGDKMLFLPLGIPKADLNESAFRSWHIIANLSSAILTAQNLKDAGKRRRAVNAIQSMLGELGKEDIDERVIELFFKEERSREDIKTLFEAMIVPIERVDASEIGRMYQMMLELEHSL